MWLVLTTAWVMHLCVVYLLFTDYMCTAYSYLCLYCQAGMKAPLLQLTPAQLAPIKQIKLAMQAAPRNDHCETCKVGQTLWIFMQLVLACMMHAARRAAKTSPVSTHQPRTIPTAASYRTILLQRHGLVLQHPLLLLALSQTAHHHTAVQPHAPCAPS